MSSLSYPKHLPYAFLVLPLVAMLAFFFLPAFGSLWMSFHAYQSNLYDPQWVGLAQYAQLLQSWPFLNALLNTALLVLGLVPAMLLFPLLMALLLQGKLWGLGLFRALIYLPVVVSMVVVGITWKWLYAKEGLINYLLSPLYHAWNIEPIAWLVNPDWALFAVAVVILWKGVAYYMMMYLANLQTLNQSLYEAAELDGAPGWRKHWHVTLPHLRPTMLLVSMISVIGSLKVFTEIYVMTRGGPLKATETVVYFIYQRAFEQLDLGMASAAGIVLALVLVGLSGIQLLAFPQASKGS